MIISLTILNNLSEDIEKKYLEILNNLDTGFFKREFEGKLLMHNRAFNKIRGFDPSMDLTGSTASAFLINPEEQTKYYNELLKNGYIRNYITEIKQANGDIKTVQINAHIVKESDNKPLIIEGTIADITEKYILEEKLKKSQQRFKQFINAATDGFVLFDSKLNYIDVNKVSLQMLRMNREELIGKNILDIAPNLKETGRYEKYLDVIKTGKSFSTEDVIFNRLDESLSSHLSVRAFKVGDNLGLIFTDITERKKTEQKLKKSEQRLRKYMDSATDGFILFDSKLNYIDANRVTQQLVGKTRDELIGKNILEIVPNLKETGRYDKYLEVIKSGKPFSSEDAIYNRQDGSLSSHLSVRTFKVGDDFGLIFTDITERKKAEAQVKLIKESLERLTDNADEVIFRVGAHGGQVTYANPTAERLFGYSMEEWISDPQLGVKIILPDFVERQKEIIEEINKNKKPIKNAVLGWKAKDGHEVIMEYNIIPIIDKNGQVVFFESIGRDITERKKAEKKIYDQVKIIESISDAIIITDLNFNIKSWNKGAEQIYGWKRSEIIGKSVPQILKTTLLSETVDVAGKKIFEEGYWKGEAIQERKDGKKIFVLNATTLVKDTDGNPIGIVGVNRDISEMKRTQQELETAEIRYRTTFEQSPDGIIIIDPESTRAIEFNEAICNLLSYTQEEFRRLKVPDYDASENPSDTRTHMEKVLKEGRDDFETKMLTKNGKIKDVYVIAKVIDLGGKTYIQSIWRDITESKQSEEKVRELMERYERLTDNADEVIFRVKAKEGYVVYQNSAAKRIFGYSLVDWQSDPLFGYKIIHPDFVEKQKQIMEEINNKKKPMKNVILGWIAKDGRKVIMEYTIIPLLDENGDVAYFESIGRDITDRKKSEDKLRLQSQMMDNMNEGVNLIRANDLRIVYANPRFEEMLGYNPGEIIGKHASIINAPTNKSPVEVADDILTVMEEKGEWHGEIKNSKKGGTPLWCYANISSFNHPEYGKVFVSSLTDITERKEAVEALKESELMLQKSQKIAKIGSFEMDLSTNEVVWSNQLYKLFGLKKEGKTVDYEKVLALIHPDDRERAIKVSSKAAKERKPYKLEHRVIHPDGRILDLLITGDVIRNDKDEVVKIGGIIQDITERKEKEKEINNLAKFPSENPNPVLRATQDRILYANKSGMELFKIGKESIIPEFLHEVIQESLSKNIKQELDVELENQIYSFTISPIKAKGYVNIYGINITERIEAEEEIANLAKFPSEDPYPVLRVNLNNVLYINKAGQKLLKIDHNDEIPEIFIVKVNEAFMNNAITKVELTLTSRIYSFNIIPIIESNYINIYGMDITERKQVEHKLKEVNKLKSEFLRRASHELKTPLISIKGFSDLILSLYIDHLDMPIISKLKEINDGCERLQNIINNLLKTSRLESPDLRPKVQKEDLSFLIKFCLHELQSLAERRKQSINLDIHSELHANIEKEEIHDVISNLLTNAIKYTPPRGKIEVKTELKKDYVVVSVSDNGIGFTEDQKKMIFQQFGKIERYGQGLDLGIDGTGLGLYISKRIVESHGGKIWMESEGRNKGSTFYFTIPVMK